MQAAEKAPPVCRLLEGFSSDRQACRTPLIHVPHSHLPSMFPILPTHVPNPRTSSIPYALGLPEALPSMFLNLPPSSYPRCPPQAPNSNPDSGCHLVPKRSCASGHPVVRDMRSCTFIVPDIGPDRLLQKHTRATFLLEVSARLKLHQPILKASRPASYDPIQDAGYSMYTFCIQ